MKSKALIFSVQRASVNFEAKLSNEEVLTLSYFEPNFNQLSSLSSNVGVKENLESIVHLLRENLKGDGKEKFIEDLKSNGNIQDFFEMINEALSEAKKEKRKNS